MAKFMHLGVPVTEPQPGEHYFAERKLYFTDPDVHPYRCEFLRFEADSPMPEDLKNHPHVAYKVDDIEAELAKCDKIILPASHVENHGKIAFAWRNGVIFELMEIKD